MRPRGLVVFAAVLPVALLWASTALGQTTTRPYDAPLITDPRVQTPPKHPNYLEQTEAGISFVYHPSAHERLRAAIPTVLQTRARLRAALGQDVLQTLEIRIAAVPDELKTLGPTEDIADYAPAIAFSRHRLILTSLGSPRSLGQNDLSLALAHALAHMALDEMVHDRPIPLWLHEGFAAHIGGDPHSTRAQRMVMTALREHLMSIADMNARFPIDAPESSAAYAHAADLTRFLLEKPHQKQFLDTLGKIGNGQDFDGAFEAAYGARLTTFEPVWQTQMARRYAFLPAFLSALGLWGLCMAAIYLRRYVQRRKVRPEQPLREEVRAPMDAEHISALEMAVARAERLPVRERGESTGAPIILETEVPKVEHEGDWHTLH